MQRICALLITTAFTFYRIALILRLVICPYVPSSYYCQFITAHTHPPCVTFAITLPVLALPPATHTRQLPLRCSLYVCVGWLYRTLRLFYVWLVRYSYCVCYVNVRLLRWFILTCVRYVTRFSSHTATATTARSVTRSFTLRWFILLRWFTHTRLYAFAVGLYTPLHTQRQPAFGSRVTHPFYLPRHTTRLCVCLLAITFVPFIHRTPCPCLPAFLPITFS